MNACLCCYSAEESRIISLYCYIGVAKQTVDSIQRPPHRRSRLISQRNHADGNVNMTASLVKVALEVDFSFENLFLICNRLYYDVSVKILKLDPPI